MRRGARMSSQRRSTMEKTYWTLVERVAAGKRWYPQYGSYDRDDCVLERGTYRGMGCRAADLKIIRSGDTQASIKAAVAKLNGADT
jgi:hypothetical protein